MFLSRAQVLKVLVAALLAATAGLHPTAMTRDLSARQVLGNQHSGCANPACPQNVEVFALIVPTPSLDLAGREWLPPTGMLLSFWIAPIPHVGRAPPSSGV